MISASNDIFEAILNLWLIIPILIILIWGSAFLKRYFQKASKQTIEKFTSSKKYLPALFFEIGQTKESLRYFMYGKKWKGRLIWRFNNVFVGKPRQVLSKHGRVVHIRRTTNFKHFFEIINKEIEWYKEKDKSKHLDDFPSELDMDCECEILSYPFYIRELESIRNDLELCGARICHLKGKAGNGKTSLACSITETALLSKRPCVLLNSRDLHGEVLEAFKQQLKTPVFFNKHLKLAMWLLNQNCHLFRRKILVIIDAINENDMDVFRDSLSDFMLFMLKYSQIKILLTCRSEYYNLRYNRLFGDTLNSYNKVVINTDSPNQQIGDEILTTYAQCFHFTGSISEAVKSYLANNLLLLRILFEVYENKSDTITSINRYVIFKKYIEKVQEIHEDIDIESILSKISELMISTQAFEGIALRDLEQVVPSEHIQKLLYDGSLLLTTKVVDAEGTIAERNIEFIDFIFDELRDYCIARRITINHKNEEEQIIGYWFQNKSSPSEGVIKYIYEHIKKLDSGRSERYLHRFGGLKLDRQRNERGNYNIGLDMIFDNSLEVTTYEIIYLLHSSIDGNPNADRDEKILDFLLDNGKNPDITSTSIDLLLNDLDALDAAQAINNLSLADHDTFIFFRYKKTHRQTMHLEWKANQAYPVWFRRFFILGRIIDDLLHRNDFFSHYQPTQTLANIFETLKWADESNGKAFRELLINGEEKNTAFINEIIQSFYWDEANGIFKQYLDLDATRETGELAEQYYYRALHSKFLFVKRFGVKYNSYIGRTLQRMHDNMVIPSRNLHFEYFQYYRREYGTYEKYLKQRHAIYRADCNMYHCIWWRYTRITYSSSYNVMQLLDLSNFKSVFNSYFGGTI